MSLMPQQPKKSGPSGQFFGPALVGACLAVVLSVPAAAYTAAWIGDTYTKRALIYSAFLLWAFCGAAVIFAKTFRQEIKPLSLGRIFLWFASAWLWPLLLLAREK